MFVHTWERIRFYHFLVATRSNQSPRPVPKTLANNTKASPRFVSGIIDIYIYPPVIYNDIHMYILYIWNIPSSIWCYNELLWFIWLYGAIIHNEPYIYIGSIWIYIYMDYRSWIRSPRRLQKLARSMPISAPPLGQEDKVQAFSTWTALARNAGSFGERKWPGLEENSRIFMGKSYEIMIFEVSWG